MSVSADIQYFVVSNRVYFLSNNVGIHFVFTYYFPMHPFRLVLMFSGITPLMKYKHIILLTHSIMTHNGPIFFFIRFIIFFVIDVIYYFFMTVMGENWCSSLWFSNKYRNKLYLKFMYFLDDMLLVTVQQ